MKSLFSILIGLHLSFLSPGTEYHVSPNGNDNHAGSPEAPLKTISAAAQKAVPGDVVTVHQGTYRERVSPPRGGESADKPIVYQASPGEKVEIKGSEIIKGWKKVNETTWNVQIPNEFFGNFNPYSDNIHGDWLSRGQWCHSGDVYLNNKNLLESQELDAVLNNKGGKALWFCKVEGGTTTIWANFNSNPNEETVEINTRQSVFYPEKPFINYIHVRGFDMSHAATPWAPPTAEQIGLIGTHWSKGWVIENNTISHSKCVGLTLGKYGDEWDNKSESEEGFVQTIERALKNKWDKEHIGSHIVRNNTISWCGQAGIAGSLGAIFSRIENNTIFETGLHQPFWGYEHAGIKLHAPVDVVIGKNHIYRTKTGIWLDWMSQGTRVTKNFLHDNNVGDLSYEVNHGPILTDNNILLTEALNQIKLSRGAVFVNNLMAGKLYPTGDEDQRKTPYMFPHDTKIAGRHSCPCGNSAFYGNIFTTMDLTPYNACKMPVTMERNLFLLQSIPSKFEKNSCVKSGFDPGIKVIQKKDGWYLKINVPEGCQQMGTDKALSSADLGKAVVPNQSFDQADGTPIVFDTDYPGNKRNFPGLCPGPVDFTRSGIQEVKVYPLKD
ncbi:right-handed parallel beta-helix repeat-containing protein [Akkermansia sp. N21116]|uniref:right-handed parallel beta-helix repeat-containing protein n=1 Tax=Akkermansia sp. N21116 TaxID=3040764 RepID=UPI00244E6C25|nr:right-handed parallel beta-helix repeat-containing protein [Akkermansia sp. N21116]WPX41038.1 right-handed parallel beta-helix repeat-containing protein [Akkermansia sp. N21116]